MSVKRTTGAFNDCYAVMDQMLRGNGGRATFPDSKGATVFRHRCYRARNILFKAAERGLRPGQIPSTPYDDLYILHEPGAVELVFKLRSRDALPQVTVNEKQKPVDLSGLDLG
jgi:hypothetical protein